MTPWEWDTSSVSILCYHAVDPGWSSPLAVAPADFMRHCEWLRRNRHVVALDELVARGGANGTRRQSTVALTFDDGFASVYDHALPPLTKHRLPATVFVVAATVSPAGYPVDWVEPSTQRPSTLSAEQILDMHARGTGIGSHGYAHHDLTQLTEEECRRDLKSSKELLEDLLHSPVTLLAYPYGRHAEHVRRAAQWAGFTCAFSIPEGREFTGQFAVPRVGVFRGNGVAALMIKTSRGYLRVRTSQLYPRLHRGLRGRAAPASPQT
jgi:peptidoglycan/xylan/chitin deacetylase (PgdA/CDA1 family)